MSISFDLCAGDPAPARNPEKQVFQTPLILQANGILINSGQDIFDAVIETP
jgi:hypothetical protein